MGMLLRVRMRQVRYAGDSQDDSILRRAVEAKVKKSVHFETRNQISLRLILLWRYAGSRAGTEVSRLDDIRMNA
jgi:hypothetical protein